MNQLDFSLQRVLDAIDGLDCDQFNTDALISLRDLKEHMGWEYSANLTMYQQALKLVYSGLTTGDLVYKTNPFFEDDT